MMHQTKEGTVLPQNDDPIEMYIELEVDKNKNMSRLDWDISEEQIQKFQTKIKSNSQTLIGRYKDYMKEKHVFEDGRVSFTVKEYFPLGF